ncbi:MAG TPA: guanylate kinase [Saprospiraceae bacterium]|nr:guanylate kinase [Saprospiraceae bacterium]
MSHQGKLIVFTAPSGAGKTTIVRHILNTFPETAFSVSATTRKRRDHEVHGVDYYYLSVETFKLWIENDAFGEWEEVYPGQFYGTLRSEISRLHHMGKHVVFDVDVKGALSIQRNYPVDTLTIFVKVPSMEVLEQRLRARGTETEENLQKRLAKAQEELTYESSFDVVLINDVLEDTLRQAEDIVRNFLL